MAVGSLRSLVIESEDIVPGDSFLRKCSQKGFRKVTLYKTTEDISDDAILECCCPASGDYGMELTIRHFAANISRNFLERIVQVRPSKYLVHVLLDTLRRGTTHAAVSPDFGLSSPVGESRSSIRQLWRPTASIPHRSRCLSFHVELPSNSVQTTERNNFTFLPVVPTDIASDSITSFLISILLKYA